MKKLILVLCLVLLASTTRADTNPLPPVPEGGLMTIMEGPCTDTVSGVSSYCVMSQDMLGNIYVIISVDGIMTEIRQSTGDSYIVVWTATPGELM